MSEEAVPVDKLVHTYLKMSSKIKELELLHKEEIYRIKEQRNLIEMELKDRMLALGASELNTESGKLKLTTKTLYSTNDWDSFGQFIVQHNATDLIQKKLHQSNLEVFLKTNPDLLPPGLNKFEQYVVSVKAVKK